MSSRALRARRLRDHASAPGAASPAFPTSQGRCEACPSVPSDKGVSMVRGRRGRVKNGTMSANGTQTGLMDVRFQGNNGHDADAARCVLMTHFRSHSAVAIMSPFAEKE